MERSKILISLTVKPLDLLPLSQASTFVQREYILHHSLHLLFLFLQVQAQEQEGAKRTLDSSFFGEIDSAPRGRTEPP